MAIRNSLSIAPGNAGEVLTSNGVASAASFQALAAGLTGVTDSISPFETALGNGAGGSSTGVNNTFVGFDAGTANTTGTDNTIVGYAAGDAITIAVSNTAIGANALGANSTGDNNTAIGQNALVLTTAANNTAVGMSALAADTSGDSNVAVGAQALDGLTTSNGNVAVGFQAVSGALTGDAIVAVGYQAMLVATGGAGSTAIGFLCMQDLTTGDTNTAVGGESLKNITTGSANISLGYMAGSSLTGADSSNIDIGHVGVAGDAGEIRIGTAGTHVKNFQAGIFGITTDVGDAIPALVDSAGQLGTVISSRRYKKDIQPIQESERLQELNPVQFRYKSHPDHQNMDFGLIAEEVVDIFPDMVVYDAEGRPETVQYQKLYGIMIAEIQRLNKRIEALEGR